MLGNKKLLIFQIAENMPENRDKQLHTLQLEPRHLLHGPPLAATTNATRPPTPTATTASTTTTATPTSKIAATTSDPQTVAEQATVG